jgi:hypothetical protein
MDYYTEYKNRLNYVRDWAFDCGLCEELVKSIQIHTDISKDYSYIKHRFVNTPMTDLSQEMPKPPKEDLEKNSEMYKRLFPQYFEDGIETQADYYNWVYDKKKKVEEENLRKKDWAQTLFSMETPHQFDWFFENSDLITDDKEFYELLRELYNQNDFPLCCLGGGRGVADLIVLIESRDTPYLMMDEKEMKMFNKLDDELTIYRGVKVKDIDYLQLEPDEIGISWSIDKNEAQKFAFRFLFSKIPILLETTINKKDVYGYFISRKEKELLINPYELKSTIKVEELDKELGIGLWKDLENV